MGQSINQSFNQSIKTSVCQSSVGLLIKKINKMW